MQPEHTETRRPLAVITGAGAGIGRALAIEAAGRGFDLALVGRDAAKLAETEQHCRQRLARGFAQSAIALMPADLRREADRRDLRVRIEQRFGAVDLLLNNAGVLAVGPLSEMSDTEIAGMVETNLLAPIFLARDLLALLRKGTKPRIVNVGSMFGDIAFPLFAAYSASKFALRGLSDALRREFAPLGIAVTYAAPRATRTALSSKFADLVAPFAMRLDEPEAVAANIFRAIDRGRTSAYPFGPERFFLLVQRLFPALVDRGIGKQYRDYLARQQGTTGAAATGTAGAATTRS